MDGIWLVFLKRTVWFCVVVLYLFVTVLLWNFQKISEFWKDFWNIQKLFGFCKTYTKFSKVSKRLLELSKGSKNLFKYLKILRSISEDNIEVFKDFWKCTLCETVERLAKNWRSFLKFSNNFQKKRLFKKNQKWTILLKNLNCS